MAQNLSVYVPLVQTPSHDHKWDLEMKSYILPQKEKQSLCAEYVCVCVHV